eukprot:PLAT3686.3.p2 GENE.PLAT3686.3~~PLAT3686.3.p2  ORF type:complete len:257 (-),score=133.67 PLAT3686.3:105-875(-)
MFLLALMSVVLCLWLLWANAKAGASRYQLLILVLGALQSLLVVAHFVVYYSLQFVLAAELVNDILLWLFCFILVRIGVRAAPATVQRVLRVVLLLTLVYFAVVYILTLTGKLGALNCLNPAWLLLAAGTLLLVALFLASGAAISFMLRNASAKYRQSKNMRVWALIIVYVIAAVGNFVWHIYWLTSTTDPDRCDWLQQSRKTDTPAALWVTARFFALVLPLWTIVLLFQLVNTAAPMSPESTRLMGAGMGSLHAGM